MSALSTRRQTGWSLVKGPVAIIGVLGIAFGIAGLIFGGHSFTTAGIPHGTITGKHWLGIALNGWTNLLFIGAGVLLLLGSSMHWGAKTSAFVVAGVLGAAAVTTALATSRWSTTSWSPAANAPPATSRSLMREARRSMHLARQRSRAPDLSDVAHAALRGAIASMAMTGMRVVTVSLGLVEQAPPQQLAGESRGTRRALVELAHWGFGALAAAGFGALPSGWRARPWTGPVYGLVIWTGFEATAPLLGLPHAEEAGVTQRLAIAGDHALYGFVLDETRRAPQA